MRQACERLGLRASAILDPATASPSSGGATSDGRAVAGGQPASPRAMPPRSRCRWRAARCGPAPRDPRDAESRAAGVCRCSTASSRAAAPVPRPDRGHRAARRRLVAQLHRPRLAPGGHGGRVVLNRYRCRDAPRSRAPADWDKGRRAAACGGHSRLAGERARLPRPALRSGSGRRSRARRSSAACTTAARASSCARTGAGQHAPHPQPGLRRRLDRAAPRAARRRDRRARRLPRRGGAGARRRAGGGPAQPVVRGRRRRRRRPRAATAASTPSRRSPSCTTSTTPRSAKRCRGAPRARTRRRVLLESIRAGGAWSDCSPAWCAEPTSATTAPTSASSIPAMLLAARRAERVRARRDPLHRLFPRPARLARARARRAGSRRRWAALDGLALAVPLLRRYASSFSLLARA